MSDNIKKQKSGGSFINSFRASAKKEWQEGWSTYRLLIIMVAFVFFAIMDPLMLKMLPLILKNQMAGIDFSSLVQNSQVAAVQMYVGDLQEIVQLVLILTCMGLVAQERSEKMLLLPASMGLNLKAALMAKAIIYSLWIALSSMLGVVITALYGGILFRFEGLSPLDVLQTGGRVALYFSAVLAIALACSTFFKRPLAAGVSAIVLIYVSPAAIGIFKDSRTWLPGSILNTADNFGPSLVSIFAVIVISLAYSSIGLNLKRLT